MDRTAFQLMTRAELRFTCAWAGLLIGFGAAAIAADRWFVASLLAIVAVGLGVAGSDYQYEKRRMKRGF